MKNLTMSVEFLQTAHCTSVFFEQGPAANSQGPSASTNSEGEYTGDDNEYGDGESGPATQSARSHERQCSTQTSVF